MSNDWLSMGGHGFYVWSAYGVAVLAIAIEIIAIRARRARARQLVRDLDEESSA